MSTHTAANLVIFGICLILLGLVGYVTHPEKAHTALISGGGFGALSILWGILGARGRRWTKSAALLTASLLGIACVWRASLGWLAVVNGQSEKVLASLMITLMLVFSGVMLWLLLTDRRAGGVEKPTGGAQ